MTHFSQILLDITSAVVWLGNTPFGIALLAAIWSCTDPFSLDGSLD